MTPEENYDYEERAGIREFDGLLARPEAEALARAEMETHLKDIEKAREGKE